VLVNVTDVGQYDYRVSRDNAVILLCSGQGLGLSPLPSSPTPPAPAAPIAGGINLPPQPAVQTAPTTYNAPVLAYIGLDGNVYLTSVGTNPPPAPLTNDSPFDPNALYRNQQGYRRPTWSPDGSRLLFHRLDKVYTIASGGAAVQIAAGKVYSIEPGWSPEGGEVAYAVDTRTADPAQPNRVILQVQAVPAGGGQPRVAGTISFGIGCGGGGFSPATVLLYDEAGYSAQTYPLYWTRVGFVHPSNCTGIGLTLTGFDGRKIWERTDLSRPALSPDGTKLLALTPGAGAPVTSGGLFVVDVATGAATPVNLAGQVPNYAAWSGDGGSIIYATSTLRTFARGNAAITNPPSIVWPIDAEINTVELWVIPATGGTPLRLYVNDNASLYAIAALSASPNVALVAFSVVESDANLVNSINAGLSGGALVGAAPRTLVGVAALAPNTPGYPYLLPGNGGQPALSRAASFNAVPVPVRPITGVVTNPVSPANPPVVPGGDNPLGLVVGGLAVVPPGENVNVRVRPTTQGDNIAGIIRPGDQVVILNGPVVSDGLRWWQVRRAADGLVGWVADIDRQGIPNLTAIR
jgi:hypothetical protein